MNELEEQTTDRIQDTTQETGAEAKWLYILAFILPLCIMLLICICNEVYPFGERCILHIDMYHQYEPFFTEFMDKLKEGGSLLYSWKIGLGSDFVSLYAYYLASPFNWLLVLCPRNHVIEFMTILILLKTALSGLNFAVYIRGHYKRTDMAAAVLAVFYALSGFMAAYNWNIMWLDCVMLAPLIVLGLEQLVKEKKCTLYCISLAVSILANFYISIMICIFLVLYYGILFLEELHTAKERIQSMGRFALYSLLAGGMGAVLIIPEAAILSYSGSSNNSFPDTVEWYFGLAEMLVRHCIDVEVYTSRDHWPNIYCGAAVFLFIILYFLNRRISWQKKIKRCLLILLFWLGFSNNVLDFLWHGMDFPDSLPGRQSFLYIFLLLTLVYEAYEKKDGNRVMHIVLALLGSLVFLYGASTVTDAGMVTPESIVITGFLILVYSLLFGIYLLGRGDLRLMAGTMILTLAVVEVYMNFDVTSLSTTSRTSYTANWDSVQTLMKEVEEQEADHFYRMEEMERLTKNDAAIYGYSSSTVFSTLMNIGVSDFYKKVGMEGGKNFYSYSGATPLTSALLSVKYLITDSPYEESPLRTLVAADGQNYIYKNTYTLPMGFVLEPDFEENWNPQSGMPVTNINKMAELLGAGDFLLKPFSGNISAGEDKTTVTVAEDGYYYATYSDRSVTNLTICNGDRVRKFNKCDHGYILDLGWCKAGDSIEITNTTDVEYFQVQPYILNMQALQKAFDTLNTQTFVTESFTDTRIDGHILMETPGYLVFSIPQENGWKVYVDGKEAYSSTFMDSLIKIPLNTGEHQITLKYRTPGLLLGAVLSLGCLLLFSLICIRKWRKK